MNKRLFEVILLLILTLIFSCGLFQYMPSSYISDDGVEKEPVYKVWTWISGSNQLSQKGNYGEKGITRKSNVPGGRCGGASWRDNAGNFWMFGGGGFDCLGNEGNLNDLWEFDGTNWIWISGSRYVNQNGVYGTKGVPDPNNVPGARSGLVSWYDKSSGNLWIFGGYGLDSVSEPDYTGYLNDLWKFDGTNWTWISGSDLKDQPGNYGEINLTAGTNIPGGRCDSISCMDKNGNFLLFGGWGFDTEDVDTLNDLWKFDGTNWTWISGSSMRNQPGEWGSKGVTGSSNMPSSRRNCVCWQDAAGILWIFGGLGLDIDGIYGSLNDLWKYDGTNWTWISGNNIRKQRGIYGIKGIPHADNIPGSRFNAAYWIDDNIHLWLFGGRGYDGAGVNNDLNDLWRFDGTNWTWVSGSNLVRQNGVYGKKGIADEKNIPGAREMSYTWSDDEGHLYLFGGAGYAGADSGNLCRDLNDMWKYNTNDGLNMPENIHNIIKINGSTFDGGGRTFYPYGLEQAYEDGPAPVFMVTNGVIKNFTLAAPTFEGIWLNGNCLVDNVIIPDVSGKALTIKKTGISAISNFTANETGDNVIQINDICTVTFKNIKCDNISKMVRQNGTKTWKCTIYIDGANLTQVTESVVRSDSSTTTVNWRNISCNLAQSSWWYGNFIVQQY